MGNSNSANGQQDRRFSISNRNRSQTNSNSPTFANQQNNVVQIQTTRPNSMRESRASPVSEKILLPRISDIASIQHNDGMQRISKQNNDSNQSINNKNELVILFGSNGSTKPIKIEIPTSLSAPPFNNIRQISLTQTHLLVLGENGELYAFKLSDSNNSQQQQSLENQNISIIQTQQNNDLGIDFTNLNTNTTNTNIQNLPIIASSITSTIPPLSNSSKLSFISAGKEFVLLSAQKGEVYGIGFSNHGELTVKSNVSIPPTIISSTLKQHFISEVACGSNHSLFLTDHGQVFACGKNSDGQLGIGSRGDVITEPTLVDKLRMMPINSIAAGESHSIACSVSGAVFSWG